jgi:hypothetical protein
LVGGVDLLAAATGSSSFTLLHRSRRGETSHDGLVLNEVPFHLRPKRVTMDVTAREPVLVDFALQGGGSHGAFTWGVLDRLRRLARCSARRSTG